jgi:hypothetical protein
MQFFYSEYPKAALENGYILDINSWSINPKICSGRTFNMGNTVLLGRQMWARHRTSFNKLTLYHKIANDFAVYCSCNFLSVDPLFLYNVKVVTTRCWPIWWQTIIISKLDRLSDSRPVSSESGDLFAFSFERAAASDRRVSRTGPIILSDSQARYR